MTDINFQPVFDYFDKSKKELKEEIITEVKSEMTEVKSKLDKVLTTVDRLDKERLVSVERTTGLEKRVTKLESQTRS